MYDYDVRHADMVFALDMEGQDGSEKCDCDAEFAPAVGPGF